MTVLDHRDLRLSIFLSALCGLLGAYSSAGQYPPSFRRIILDGDELWGFGTSSPQFVRRGKIRTILHGRNGLLVSERGRLGAFWGGGGVWISRQLPGYADLEALVESWRIQAQ